MSMQSELEMRYTWVRWGFVCGIFVMQTTTIFHVQIALLTDKVKLQNPEKEL